MDLKENIMETNQSLITDLSLSKYKYNLFKSYYDK